MTAPSAWRPLSEAPKDRAIFVNCKGARFVSPANDEFRCSHEGALFVPMVADTLELDRAVQILVVQAFTLLFAGMQNLVLARENPCQSRSFAEQYVGYCIRQAAPMMHVAFDGRIPDEVPHAP